MFGKRLLTFILILSFVSSVFYMPTFTPRAHAIFGFGDLVIDIKQLARNAADGVAMAIARRMVDDMVRSTVEWAQTGFEGNPAYATNPAQYFGDIADGVAGDFIGGSDLGFLCSPFEIQIRLALINSYTRPTRFQCTFTEAVGNLEAFYDDFDNGGWDAWFTMTQTRGGNPYGAFLEAQAELDRRVAAKTSVESQKLDWNQGFLSWSECVEEDEETGKCLKRDPNTKTPGSIIKSQLENVLPSGLDQLVTVEHVEQLVGAFAQGLLTRYVFSSDGLFDGAPHGDAPAPFISEPDLCDLVRGLPGGEGLDADCIPASGASTGYFPSPSPTSPFPPGTPPPGTPPGTPPPPPPPGTPPPPPPTEPTVPIETGSDIPGTTLEWASTELEATYERYVELLAIKASRPGGLWTASDFLSGLVAEFTSLLGPLGNAYSGGFICSTVEDGYVPLGTVGAGYAITGFSCQSPATSGLTLVHSIVGDTLRASTMEQFDFAYSSGYTAAIVATGIFSFTESGSGVFLLGEPIESFF